MVVVLFYMRMCGVRAFSVLHGNALACLSHAWVCACVCHCGGVPMCCADFRCSVRAING